MAVNLTTANAVISRSKYSSQEVFEGSVGHMNPTSNTSGSRHIVACLHSGITPPAQSSM